MSGSPPEVETSLAAVLVAELDSSSWILLLFTLSSKRLLSCSVISLECSTQRSIISFFCLILSSSGVVNFFFCSSFSTFFLISMISASICFSIVLISALSLATKIGSLVSFLCLIS
eukprot:NODE_229_length_13800_cov_0.838114.p11 type:complete len:116 gc:universal NODE_229_length_13800_cov_0.838114:8825-8478(-)